MRPEISIIIPIYKTERFLKKCINSIIDQSFKQWELILVNDCSPDNSSKILSEYKKKDNRIKIINHSVNKGSSQARFTGLENAVGKYIMFVDSDDWLTKNAVQVLYNRIEEGDSDIVIGSMIKVLDQYGIFKTKPQNSVVPKIMTESIVMPELFDKYFINYFGVNLFPSYMWGKIYRRKTLDKAPLEPMPFFMFEDMVFNLTLHPFLAKIDFVPDTVYCYRSGGGTSQTTPDFLKTVKIQYQIKENYIQKYNYTTAIPYIKYEIINCFYSHFKNLVLLDKLSYSEVERRIEEEVKDDFYNKDIFEGIEISEKALALKTKDSAKMIRIVRENVKKDRPRHILKKMISKIL